MPSLRLEVYFTSSGNPRTRSWGPLEPTVSLVMCADQVGFWRRLSLPHLQLCPEGQREMD